METPELNFIVDDLLLDFPGDDTVDAGLEAAPATGTSTDNSFNSTAEQSHFTPATDVGGPCNFTADVQFSGELTVPEDDLAELEWVSKFVEESFSSEDLQKLQLIQGIKAQTTETPQYQFQPQTPQTGPAFQPEVSVPAKARSKRSRTAPDNWTSRLLAVSPTPAANAPAVPLSSENDKKTSKPKKREGPENLVNGEGRRCLHCATSNTPQWRTGPMGPKTLCNACGVRYKSGRLVPEYRPAASPTFVLSKHSNSHRKVLELRRQKEMQQQQQFLHHHHHHQNMMFDMSNGDEYLIHQHIGPGPIFGS